MDNVVQIFVMKRTADEGVYRRTATFARPVAPSRSVFVEGAAELPGGSTRFASVPARLAVRGDVIVYQEQTFEVAGVVPEDSYGMSETIETVHFNGDVEEERAVGIGGVALQVGGATIELGGVEINER